MSDRQALASGDNDALARRIVEASPVGLGVVDLSARRLVAFNREFVRAFGGSGIDLGSADTSQLASLVDPRDAVAFASYAQRLQALPDGESIAFDIRLRGDDGRIFAVRCAPFGRDGEGRLRQLVVSVDDVTAQRRDERALRRSESLFAAFREHMPALMFAKDGDGVYLMTTPSAAEFLGLPPGAIVGRRDADFLPPEVAARFAEDDERVRASPTPIELEEQIPNRDGGISHFFSIKFAVRGPGIPAGTIGGISIDLTRAKVAEAEREAAVANEALIAAQQETIRMLASPLMPIAEGVVVMPLIGSIDEERAARIMEALLDGIGRHRASIAILDITGVKSVDLQVAEALLRTARAVGLLGARVILTGISPHVAQTLVSLGVDWQGLATEGTLRDGIAHALRARPAEPAR